MAMAQDGLAKLHEEAGELQQELANASLQRTLGRLQQVTGKLLAYPDGDHPDGGESLAMRLEKEIADVIAACYFVGYTHELNDRRIQERITAKLKMYHAWHEDPLN